MKIQKLLLFAIIVYAFNKEKAVAQILFRNELYDTTNYYNNFFYNVLQKNNQYYLTLTGAIINDNNFTNSLIVFDNNLNNPTESSYTFYNRYTTLYNGHFNRDSTRIYGCGFQTYDGNSKGYIYIFNLEGDTTAFFNVGDNTYNWRIIEALEMPDHTILAVGGRSKYPFGGTNPWDEYPLAMKLDTLGNVFLDKVIYLYR